MKKRYMFVKKRLVRMNVTDNYGLTWRGSTRKKMPQPSTPDGPIKNETYIVMATASIRATMMNIMKFPASVDCET